MIAHVTALSENRVIGVEGDLPWRIPSDLKHFKALTLNKCIVMGRKTFESLPGGALPKRQNIIITRDKSYTAANCIVVDSIEKALQEAQRVSSDGDIMIVGGAEIYRQTLAVTDKLYLTIIHKKVNGDAIYPEWKNDFKLESQSEPQTENGYTFTFETWVKK